MGNNILIIAAHPDDELLGVGGTVSRLSRQGKTVRALVLAEGQTSRTEKRENTGREIIDELRKDALSAAKEIGYASIDFCDFPDNRLDSVDLLDIIKSVFEFIDQYKPDTIFTHHHGDLNIDHRRVCEAVLTAVRPMQGEGVKRIYAFETPSSTEWNYVYEAPFCPNVYFDISETINRKLAAMACYKSELREYPHPRSLEALKALASYRGSNVGYRYAEAFLLLRELFDGDQSV